MKKAFLIIVGILAFALISKAQSEKLTGKWVNEKFKVSYTFKESGSVIFEQGGASVFISSFELDESKNPIWLDFTIKQGGRSIIIPSLLEFIDENAIKIEQFTPGINHPLKFSKKEEFNIRNQQILRRE